MTRATKIVPPAIPSWSIQRPKLEARLDESLSRRLTTVVAGAGFGKSTLLACWSRGVAAAWYTVDAGDEALGTFAPGLVDALRVQVPDLPSDLSATPIGPGASPGEEKNRAEAFASYLSESLQERTAGDLVLVLDDLQELDRESPAARVIEGLSRHAPPNLHLVISSRFDPPFVIERLRGRGQILSLEPSALAFSREEVAELLDGSAGSGAADLAESLHEMTGGWPAAVRLGVEALRTGRPERAAAVLEGLRRPGGALFAYLAEEVLAREPASVRSFLRRVAPFERFSIELCEALGIKNAGPTLAGLLRRGLFVQPQGGPEGWFKLHALIREFVLLNWPLPPRDIRALHRRAAGWFEGQGHLDETLRSLALSSDARAIARLLAERGDELLGQGAVDSVLELAKMVPASLREDRIDELVGEAHAIRGEATLAQEAFRRVARDAQELPPGLALRIGFLHHERGEHELALSIYARGRIDGSQPAREAVLLAAMASAHVLIGHVEESLQLTRRAVELARVAGDDRATAAAHAALMLHASDADPQTAHENYRVALEAAERARDVLTSVRIRTNHASHLDDEGAYQEALEELEIAIRHAELAGYTKRLALALNNRGESRFHLGQLDEAMADFERSKALYQRAGSLHAAWPLLNLGTVFRERGDLAMARAALEEALALAERSEDVQGLIGARSELARILVGDEPGEATRLAESAIEIGRAWGGLVDALVAAGWVALARGQRERAAELAEEAAQESRTRHHRPSLAEALELRALASADRAREAGRLEDAIAIWREVENPLGEARAELALARLSSGPAAGALADRAERRLRGMGVRVEAAAGAAGLLASLPREDDPPVAIRTLGGFRVLRHGQPVPASDWQSKKARDLLKILVARRGRPAPREFLMDALWPDEDPERLPKRLSVVLATLRAVLDPDRDFPSEHFVAGDDEALWIDRDHVPIDVEGFLAEAAAGLALLRRGRTEDACEFLSGAEAGYTGDFLEEDPYEEWAASLREEARANYIAVARALANTAAKCAGQEDAGVRYNLRILERDPFDEEAHLGLVSTLVGAGRHGEARRAYRAYVARMEELDVEPAPYPGSGRPALETEAAAV